MQSQRLEFLRPKMDGLFKVKASWEARGRDINENIQGGREFRNPRILEKLIENCKIKQYGTNFPKDKIDPEAYYESKRYRRLREEREREKVFSSGSSSMSGGSSALPAAPVK